MAAIEVIYGESGWLRVGVCSLNNTEITAFGSKLDFTYAIKSTSNFAAAAEASTEDTKYFETTIANGNKLSVIDNSKNYLLSDGSVISTTTGNTATKDTMECSVTAGQTLLSSILDAYRNGNPVFAIREIGKSPTTGTAAGFDYIFGIISDYKETTNTSATTIDFTITAKKIGNGLDYTLDANLDETDFNSEYTGATNTITPANDGAARTITALTSTDWNELKSGKIVRK